MGTAIDGHAGPGATRDDDSEDHAVAHAGTVDGFGCGEAVGVILDAELSAEDVPEVLLDRTAIDPGGAAPLAQPGLGGQ